jgi:hypothetical protein
MSIGTITKIKCNSKKNLLDAMKKAEALGLLPKGVEFNEGKPFNGAYDKAGFERYHGNHKMNYGPPRGIVDYSIDFSKRKFYGYINMPGMVSRKNGFFLECAYLYWNTEEGCFELLFDIRGDYEGGTKDTIELGQKIAAKINGILAQGIGVDAIEKAVKGYGGGSKIMQQSVTMGKDGKNVIKIQIKVPKSIAKTIGKN